jgi:hypothetical protein
MAGLRILALSGIADGLVAASLLQANWSSIGGVFYMPMIRCMKNLGTTRVPNFLET